ncbi:stage II sporulation protein R [Desulfitispora alkaliphila]|uniref:stage II sporulation protein R n=1 Tax=Desulfitispora alkaliphila TaxID=622674 RepID=UPI003D25C10C
MKKGNNLLRWVLIGSFMTLFFAATIWSPSEVEVEQTVVDGDQLIRFHVIANSDDEEDQIVKEQIKDYLVIHMEDKLVGAEDVHEAREIILDELTIMEELAQDLLMEKGFAYSAASDHSTVYFPTRMYGSAVFPAGEYETVRIMLGEAKGENWWCLLFPPLCFIDATQANSDLEVKSDEEVVVRKFKLVELWKDFLEFFKSKN